MPGRRAQLEHMSVLQNKVRPETKR